MGEKKYMFFKAAISTIVEQLRAKKRPNCAFDDKSTKFGTVVLYDLKFDSKPFAT